MNKKEVTLLLGSYQSQHLGFSESERDGAYDHIYKPLLKTLYSYSSIRFSLYFAGIIYEWLDRHHSEFVDVLSEMTRRRQVELIGGGFYEPVFPLIPKADRLGQIERLTAYIRKQFGRRPRGGWIPAGIWDQRIASSLSNGGIEYIFLDARATGLPSSRDHDPFLTEDQGKVLSVFPIADQIREMFFLAEPDAIIEEIARTTRSSTERPVLTVFFEMPGSGPNQEPAAEWLARMFDAFVRNSDWIHLDVPARVHKNSPLIDRFSVPTTRYSDLTDWQPGIPGKKNHQGTERWTYRSILDYYPEAARLYAKMQYTQVLVNQVRGDKYRKMTAREELWKGQSHYAYWHNPAGGVYRSELRKATYAALLEAEKSTREKGIFIPSLLRLDFDLDGKPEVLYQGNEINAYVHLYGAYIFELDYLAHNWNYLDTITRRPESFHDDQAREAGYDRWPRSAFVDHLFKTRPEQGDFARGKTDLLCDISRLPYTVETLDKEHDRVVLLGVCDIGLATLEIRKQYRFNKNRIELNYELANEGMEPVRAVLGTEVNLSFYSIDPGNLRVVVRQGRQRQEFSPERINIEGVSDVQFADLHGNTNVVLNPSGRPDMWSFPVYAQALLSGGRAWLYQSNSTVFLWPVDLEPGQKAEVSVILRFDVIR